MKQLLLSIYKFGIKLLWGSGLGVKFPFKQINDSVHKILRKESIEFLGHTIFLDPLDSLYLSINGIYEPFETELVQTWIKQGDVVVDIGANIGYYSLIFAKMVGEKGHVYCFEPDPDNFALLKKNIQTNGYKNLTLEKKAVSTTTGKLKLYISNENQGDHRTYSSDESRASINIDTICLDDYLKDKKVDFVKMDIQGYESMVVEGGIKFFKRNKKVKIITEYWPYGMNLAGGSAKNFLATFQDLGYKLFEIDESDASVKKTSIAALNRKYTIKNELYTNLLITR